MAHYLRNVNIKGHIWPVYDWGRRRNLQTANVPRFLRIDSRAGSKRPYRQAPQIGGECGCRCIGGGARNLGGSFIEIETAVARSGQDLHDHGRICVEKRRELCAARPKIDAQAPYCAVAKFSARHVGVPRQHRRRET